VAFIEGPELVVVLIIVLLVFGGSRLPQLARSLGQAQREFQNGLRHDETDAKNKKLAPDPDNRREARPLADGTASEGPADDPRPDDGGPPSFT
jgi:sec-independent protein translocase protein TatA